MTVNELIDKLKLKALCLPDGGREVNGAYAGDLLSWVMGRAKADCAWVTIMSNMNVPAVAQLADVACVIFAEGVTPEAQVVEAASRHDINLLASPLDTYSICAALSVVLP